MTDRPGVWTLSGSAFIAHLIDQWQPLTSAASLAQHSRSRNRRHAVRDQFLRASESHVLNLAEGARLGCAATMQHLCARMDKLDPELKACATALRERIASMLGVWGSGGSNRACRRMRWAMKALQPHRQASRMSRIQTLSTSAWRAKLSRQVSAPEPGQVGSHGQFLSAADESAT